MIHLRIRFRGDDEYKVFELKSVQVQGLETKHGFDTCYLL